VRRFSQKVSGHFFHQAVIATSATSGGFRGSPRRLPLATREFFGRGLQWEEEFVHW